MEEMNEFDLFLKFTLKNRTDNTLNFLDTTISFVNSQLILTQYRKPESSDCLINFHKGVAPKAYKFSTLIGEVYRAYNCNTTEDGLTRSLKKSSRFLKKNQFPKSLVQSKIAEVVDREFGPSPNKALRLEELENPDLKHVTISLPYTSFRCSQVASKIYNILRTYTPNFRLDIAFTSVKLSRVIQYESLIIRRLKPKIDVFHSANITYQFKCSCSSVYIGETSKLLELRIYQHRTDKNSHIFQHTEKCQPYKLSLTNTYGDQPNDSNCREHLKKFFTVVEGNLQNTNARKTFEGLMITLNQPDLNKQVLHRSTALVCSCLLPNQPENPGV